MLGRLKILGPILWAILITMAYNLASETTHRRTGVGISEIAPTGPIMIVTTTATGSTTPRIQLGDALRGGDLIRAPNDAATATPTRLPS